jgi:cell wall-associated NlpC family hydrolase
MLVNLRRALAHAAVVLGVLVASCVVAPPSADALTRHQKLRIIRIATSKEGAPYRYGAEGPRRFDCSGYTRWVFDRAGFDLPRTSRAQARATRRVSRAHRRWGDLVFFSSHGRVYHVGIYAGRNRIWHAPRTGERVHRERLWTSDVTYGRVH